MPENALAEPWRSFLHELDARLEQPTELHCFGGFVIASLYDLTRVTADVDVIEVRGEDAATMATLAGRSKAAKRPGE